MADALPDIADKTFFESAQGLFDNLTVGEYAAKERGRINEQPENRQRPFHIQGHHVAFIMQKLDTPEDFGNSAPAELHRRQLAQIFNPGEQITVASGTTLVVRHFNGRAKGFCFDGHAEGQPTE